LIDPWTGRGGEAEPKGKNYPKKTSKQGKARQGSKQFFFFFESIFLSISWFGFLQRITPVVNTFHSHVFL
jgi:hypothetical protein